MNESTVSNGIQTRQNQEENVAKLVAADRLYCQAKRLDFLRFLFSVVFPCLLSLIQPFFAVFGKFAALLSVISMLVSYWLKPAIEKKIRLSADIKQDYDVTVFDMPWNEALFGTRKNLTSEIAENNEPGQSQTDFRDWYRPEADAMTLEEGIFACQRENYTWDGNLRRRYKNLCAWGAGFLIVLIVVIEILRDASVVALLERLAFVVPILSWILDIVGALNADLKRLEAMKAAFQSVDEQTMEDLQEIQKMIYEHRKSSVTPPGFIYSFFKEKDEQTAQKMIK